jgi:hypothetical protein
MCNNCDCCHVPDYGACDEFEEGANGRCVYCDHAKECHPGSGKLFNGPLSPISRKDLEMNNKNEDCFEALQDVLKKLRDAKPEERSELARRYAVTITELEKVIAYFWFYIVTDELK